MSLRKSSRRRKGSKSVVLPKPNARRRWTPAPSVVGFDLMTLWTGRMDMLGSFCWPRPARQRGAVSRTRGQCSRRKPTFNIQRPTLNVQGRGEGGNVQQATLNGRSRKGIGTGRSTKATNTLNTKGGQGAPGLTLISLVAGEVASVTPVL